MTASVSVSCSNQALALKTPQPERDVNKRGLVRGIRGPYPLRVFQIGAPERQEQQLANYVIPPHPSD
jgi:hypothetical protein